MGKSSVSAGFFQVISEEAIMGIMAFHRADGSCIYINQLAREILEIPGNEDDSISLKIEELYEAEDRPGLARGFKQGILEFEGLYQDVLMRKKNGHLLISNIGIKHVAIDQGTPVLLVMFQDVTVQKKLQREVHSKQEEIQKAHSELVEQNRQLKELDLAKDRFLALTTHELRTPLAAILATTDFLVLKLTDSEEQKDELIVTIQEQAQHLMEIVNDILDFAKIRAGKLEFFVESLDFTPIIRKVVSNFEQMANHAKVKITLSEPAAPVLAWIDSLRFKEVIDNVVNNAIKYNQPGGSVTIGIKAEEEGFLQIAVTDTGPGIAADKISHVFNEFETVGTVARHHKGTGLGMPISKRLIESMGGRLSLESEVGVGTTFFIDVPLEKVLGDEMYRSRPDRDADLAA
jgi:signal transduction histidine kinase